MKSTTSFFVLVGLYVLGTVFGGWWAVLAIGAAWGIVVRPDRSPGFGAAWAAAFAWALLLGWTAMQGPIGQLARRVAGTMGIPTVALFLLSLAFAAVVGGGAAWITSWVRRLVTPGR